MGYIFSSGCWFIGENKDKGHYTTPKEKLFEDHAERKKNTYLRFY